MESEFDWSSLLMFQFCRSAAVKHTVQLGKAQSLDRDSSVNTVFQQISSCAGTLLGVNI